MCGILGIVARSPVNQLLYDGLLLLQHRGQDAAGIVTSANKTFHMQKGTGMVQNVFRTRNMRSLPGEIQRDLNYCVMFTGQITNFPYLFDSISIRYDNLVYVPRKLLNTYPEILLPSNRSIVMFFYKQFLICPV